MKIVIPLICFLFLTIAQSQDLNVIELLPPESQEVKDLSFLKEELKGVQFIMLGEQTHMYGNIFEMKARVIEYLHQELGYKTIAMESSMYDIWKMNQNGFNEKDFNNAIWEVWSSTLEFQRLVDYIDRNELKVIGFDSQVNNTSQFIEDFFAYCKEQNITINLDEDDFGIVIEGVFDNVTVDEDDITYEAYEKELYRIIDVIDKLESNETNYYWKQLTKGLLACSQDAYYNKEEILTTDFGNKNYNIRDKHMADNLLSYISRNPDEKIICWADNIHVINDISSVKKSVVKEFVSMGSYINNELKDKSYSLATIHANDSLLDLGTNKWYTTSIQPDSFEDKLDGFGIPYLFVSSSQEAMKSERATRLLNFIDFTEARVDQLHDGYIFFQNATLPQLEMRTDSVRLSDKQLGLSKKIEQIKAGKKQILKGQILDKESETPIPFATLILKKEGIYRVADENGYYELPVNTLMQDATISISSLGFETNNLLIKELNEKAYLRPKFEQLEEVIVTGHLSPITVLKEAITRKEMNHPVESFNFYRYGKVLVNRNDSNELDLELITKDYDDGYLSPFIITHRVEQIKWNTNTNPKRYKYSSQFFSYRQNAIRYANILHKRKYQKFKLNFLRSENPLDEGLYIISFQTERNKWNYTNRGYPTKYSGRVYIDKDTYAIVKVLENWETTLNKDEIEKYFKGYEIYRDIIETTLKEENICVYTDISGNGKYFATQYFNRRYSESLNDKNEKNYSVFERDSYLFDFELKNVEEIPFEFREKEQTVLNRASYDKTFWDSFYKRELGIKTD